MRVKTMIMVEILSYLLTGLCLMFLAFLLFRFDLGEKPVSIGITGTYVLSCLFGGILAGKGCQKNRFLWGMLAGLIYFLIFLIISWGVSGDFYMSFGHVSTTFCLCLGGGMLGGMLS